MRKCDVCGKLVGDRRSTTCSQDCACAKGRSSQLKNSHPPVSEIKPGQVWSWAEPTGKRRTMLVQYFIDSLLQQRRVCGIHPQSKKRIQVPLAVLTKGLRQSKLEYVIEGYAYVPQSR